MGKISPPSPRLNGPFLNGLNNFLLIPSSNQFSQTNGGGSLIDIYWDSASGGSVIVAVDALSLRGNVGGSSLYVGGYPGFMIENSSGVFSRYTTAVDAEILNVFADDQMYIGPYQDPVGTLSGATVVYRAGYGNEGDGTWFASLNAEFSFNTLNADVTAGLGACFWIQGLQGVPTRPVLHVQARQTGTVVQRLTSEATNDNPIEQVVQNRVATTDATVTTIHTFTVPASTTYAIQAVVIARRTGGVSGTAEDGARYILNAVYKNAAGTATIIGAITVTADESVGGYDATFTTSGATVLCRVTGAATTNITWHMTARTWQVST
jgi:hypothetical protein